ncbi:MAG: hypothetical protein R3228_11685, partial [Halioglobus sp.]|nr:hypothetical protein [Halioglobus sp.]
MLHFEGVEAGPVPARDVTITPRIANSPRRVCLPDGGTVESSDHEVLAALEQQFHRGPVLDVHRWESRLRYILFAVLVIGAAAGAMVTWGIPWMSRGIAFGLPTAVAGGMADGAMELLAESYLQPSRLSAARQAEVTALLAPYLPTDTGYHYRILFRDSGVLGANALALPDGTIVFTDA